MKIMIELTKYLHILVQVSVCGGLKSFYPFSVDKVLNFSNIASFIRRPSGLYFNNVGNSKLFVSTSRNARSLYQNGSPNLRHCVLNSYQVGVVDESHYLGSKDTMFVENSAADDQLVDFLSNTIKSVQTASHSFNMDADSLSFLETKFSDIVSKLRESAADASNIGENLLNEFSDTVTLSLTTALKNTNQAVDSSINEIISFINKSAGSPGGKLKETSGKAVPFALDVLRGIIVVVENSLGQGGSTVKYAYSFVKEFLPSEVQEAVHISGTAIQQVYLIVVAFQVLSLVKRFLFYDAYLCILIFIMRF